MPEPAMNPHLARHTEQLRRRPLTERQRAVLAFAQARFLVDRPFPTDAEIMARFATFHRVADVQASLLALEARGLLQRLETRFGKTGGRIVTKWAIAEAAWQVPLFDGEIAGR